MPHQGTVKMYDAEKGFGFIAADDGTRDVFFHSETLSGDHTNLKADQRVEYELSTEARNPQAESVRLLR
ncbi:cold shock domain-containing protein [Streptomyces europaeiscabiei]|nr:MULTISPECIES: cold shock domain-containing protein [Streptomyces]MDX3209107.1 cold shock domain-containing protein [Streptomyces scabiei]MDX3636986.1 cold shock domain-containing protein [Streptomyces europaeiscabiei]MDX3655130.1 cold shock domain-containing protein [Streptomyces europaeiscabiei]